MLSENILEKFEELLGETWPQVREVEKRAQQRLNRKNLGPLSRRFNNEIRDALDHLYRAVHITDDQSQIRNLTAIQEHMRRAVVESLEYLVEYELLQIRPIPIGWDYFGFKKADRSWPRYLTRIWKSRHLWAEFFRKFFLVRSPYDKLVMTQLLQGKKCLIDARKLKGVDTERVITKLEEALECYGVVSEHIQNHNIKLRFYAIIQGLIGVAIGGAIGLLLTCLA